MDNEFTSNNTVGSLLGGKRRKRRGRKMKKHTLKKSLKLKKRKMRTRRRRSRRSRKCGCKRCGCKRCTCRKRGGTAGIAFDNQALSANQSMLATPMPFKAYSHCKN